MCGSELFRIHVELVAYSEHRILGASGEVTVAFCDRVTALPIYEIVSIGYVARFY